MARAGVEHHLPTDAHIYYGISQQHKGPAVRDTGGTSSSIVQGGGGGKGEWSAEQLPNASGPGAASSSGDASEAPLLFLLPADPGERHNVTAEAAVVARLRAVAAQYEATRVPQLGNDPSCPKYVTLASDSGAWVGPWCDAGAHTTAPTPAPPPPPAPPAGTCERWCYDAGHCCVGRASSYGHPSCAMGCIAANYTANPDACAAVCRAHDSNKTDQVCAWSIGGVKMNNCVNCPPGCSAKDGASECVKGCQHAHGL